MPPILNRIQGMVNKFMTQRCNILQAHQVNGVYGEAATAWHVVELDVPCRIIMAKQITNTTTTQVGEQETLEEHYRLVCRLGTVLAVDMRVEVEGMTYTVVSVKARLADATDVQAIITKLEPIA